MAEIWAAQIDGKYEITKKKYVCFVIFMRCVLENCVYDAVYNIFFIAHSCELVIIAHTYTLVYQRKKSTSLLLQYIICTRWIIGLTEFMRLFFIFS